MNFFRSNSVNPTFSSTVSFLYGAVFCPALEAPEDWLGFKGTGYAADRVSMAVASDSVADTQRQAKRTLSLISNLLMSFALNQQNFESTSINSLVQAQSSKASAGVEQWLVRASYSATHRR